MKISLKELKARSKYCGRYPRLIEIARVAKSPTAAFEMAKQHFKLDCDAIPCRYLAMIKRDYGTTEFERVAKEIQKEGRAQTVHYYLRPFMQTAVRLSFLSARCSANCPSISFAPHEMKYVEVVAEIVRRYGAMDSEDWDMALKGCANLRVWLAEAKHFLYMVRENQRVDGRTLQETALAVAWYVMLVGRDAGVPDIALDCSDALELFKS